MLMWIVAFYQGQGANGRPNKRKQVKMAVSNHEYAYIHHAYSNNTSARTALQHVNAAMKHVPVSAASNTASPISVKMVFERSVRKGSNVVRTNGKLNPVRMMARSLVRILIKRHHLVPQLIDSL